jgi:hypothetical protein
LGGLSSFLADFRLPDDEPDHTAADCVSSLLAPRLAALVSTSLEAAIDLYQASWLFLPQD